MKSRVVYAPLIWPRRILASLERVRAAGIPVGTLPNLWQLELGVLRMWHRLLFRSDTIGMSRTGRVRPNWRARLLALRPLRFPFLLAERAVAPFDFTGLASSPDRVIRHLLGAHHDENQFVFDLELLSCHLGRLAELRDAVVAIVRHDTPRSRWLRDLAVFEGYHEALLAAVERALAHGIELSEADAGDADVSFRGYLAWCARQPATPLATLQALRAGRLRFAPDAAGAAQ